MKTGIRHLQTKILIGTIGIVVLLGLSTAVAIQAVLYQKLMASLEKRGAFIARTVAGESINPLLTDRHFELTMMVRGLKESEKDIEYIFVVNGRGDVVAHTFDRGFPADLKKLGDTMNGRGGYHIERLESEKGNLLDFSVPLMKGEAGAVHVGMTEKPVRQDVNAMIALLLGIILAVLLVVSGLAAAFSAAITKPLKELARAAAAVGGGNMEQKISVRTSDEIGRLGAAFNAMMAQRKEAEDRIQASEKKLRDVTSNLAEGLYVVDDGGKLTFLNPEAERLLGWTMDELNEKGAHDLVHFRRADGTPLPLAECAMHNVIKSGATYFSAEEVFVRKDGTVFPISVVSSPIFEEGRVIASVTAFRDISERKALEQEREQLILDHLDALSKINTLSGLLPICASCKRIRDDQGYWNQIEAYIQQHSGAEFSHGICPECAKKIYPEFYGDKS